MPLISMVGGRAKLAAAKHCKAVRRYQGEILARRPGAFESSFGFLGVKPVSNTIRWAPDRRLMMPMVNMAGPGSRLYLQDSGDGDFWESEFGAPSIYWEPDKSTNGDGTLGNPYQYSQLSANISAGDVVGILPGFEELASTSDDDTPAFYPNVDGTALSRIVYVGQYNPGAMGNPLTDANRTQIGHTGTNMESGSCPTIGTLGNDYVTFAQIVLNAADGAFGNDGGAFQANGSAASHFKRLWVQAVTHVSSESTLNYCGFWNQDTTDVLVSDCTIKGFRFSASTSENISAIILYSALGFTIENLTIEDCNQAINVKGNNGTGSNYGVFRRNRVIDSGRFAQIQVLDVGETTEFYQNLVTGTEVYGIRVGEAGGVGIHNLRIYNNTIVLAGSADGSIIVDNEASAIDQSGFSFFENICVAGASAGAMVNFFQEDMDFVRVRDNIYYRSSGSYDFAENGFGGVLSAYQTHLNSTKSADQREENSVNSDPDLTVDFEPDVGSPALTMGTASGLGGAGGPIGHTGGNPDIGVRA